MELGWSAQLVRALAGLLILRKRAVIQENKSSERSTAQSNQGC